MAIAVTALLAQGTTSPPGQVVTLTDQATGTVLGTTTSDPVTGAWSIPLPWALMFHGTAAAVASASAQAPNQGGTVQLGGEAAARAVTSAGPSLKTNLGGEAAARSPISSETISVSGTDPTQLGGEAAARAPMDQVPVTVTAPSDTAHGGEAAARAAASADPSLGTVLAGEAAARAPISAETMGVSGGAPTLPNSDSFTQANGGLSSNWATAPSASAPQVSGNQVTAETTGYAGAYWNVDAPNPSYSECVVTPGSPGATYGVGPAVRMSTSQKSYYAALITSWDDGEGNSGVSLTIYKMVNGVMQAYLATTDASGYAGVVIRIEITSGNVITVKSAASHGGSYSTRLTYTDNTSPLAAGRDGIVFEQTPGDYVVDSWYGG